LSARIWKVVMCVGTFYALKIKNSSEMLKKFFHCL
jgi:hypothetical protein